MSRLSSEYGRNIHPCKACFSTAAALCHWPCSWLRSLELSTAGANAELDRYIGYWKPYATSHDDLDADLAIQEEVRNAARTLLEGVQRKLEGKLTGAGEALRQPRQK